ncbi:MAG: M23 family metallopeptidase [Bacillota bacterium]
MRYSGRLRKARTSSANASRWLLCALVALLVAGMNYLPFGVINSCRSFLSYCFQPGAAEGTVFAAWADWQPNGERLSTVWRALTGQVEEDEGLAYPCTGRVSSGYGWRYHPVSGKLEMHYALDIVSAEGAAVQSAGAGKVIEVRNDENLGICLLIDHGQSVSTEYGHLQGVSVAVGDQVKKGQEIGTVGMTGVTNEAHLHFAVLVDGQPEDPLLRLQQPR